MTTVADDDQHLIGWARMLAQTASTGPTPAEWRYRSVAQLLVETGRLFRPGPPPGDPGPARQCYRNASTHSDTHNLPYVEGLALTAQGLVVEHAWCAGGDDGADAIDPTWTPPIQPLAYLGVPLTPAWRRARQLATGMWSMLWSDHVADLLRNGLPAEAVAAAGRQPKRG